MIALNDLNAYFETHPLNSRYLEFAASDRTGALAVAQRDVRSALGTAAPEELTGEPVFPAVCEQTIFLLLHPERLAGDADGLASESASGASRTYRTDSGTLCVRAREWLAPLLERNCPGLRLSRG